MMFFPDSRALVPLIAAVCTVSSPPLRFAKPCHHEVPWAVISTFLTDYLATNAHLGVPGATAVLFSFGIGCFAGTAVGGTPGVSGEKDMLAMAFVFAHVVLV